MITESKVIELFCIADDFCRFFDAMTAKYTLKPVMKRSYHRTSTMSKAEITLIMILFNDSGYRCIKHYYTEKFCRHMRQLFPKIISYYVLLCEFGINMLKTPSQYNATARKAKRP